MQRPSIASCFATYVLPHVLFVADFEERERIARVCCLAWNIGLFPDASERESHVGSTLDLLLDGGDAPPPGLRQGFGEELRMLAGLKRDLFPWQLANVLRADLEPGPGGLDVLSVEADGAVERVELALSPPIAGLPRITKALVQIHKDTKAQRHTLEEARMTPGLVEHVVTRDMLTAYCAQRADLRSYHRMLSAWSEASSEPELKSGIGRFLLAVDEIEADTKAVLGILAAAQGVPWER